MEIVVVTAKNFDTAKLQVVEIVVVTSKHFDTAKKGPALEIFNSVVSFRGMFT